MARWDRGGGGWAPNPDLRTHQSARHQPPPGFVVFRGPPTQCNHGTGSTGAGSESETYLVCGLDILERGWFASYEQECSDTGLDPEQCQSWYSCLHDRLRESHPGEVGTRWMLTEIYAGGALGSGVGDAALDAAIEACTMQLSEQAL